MILILFLIILFSQNVLPQGDSSSYLDIYSPSNIRKFADYLYCTQDYLRAAIEYEKVLNLNYNDTLEFKTGLAYSSIGDFNKALSFFENINTSSKLFYLAKEEYFKSLFQMQDYDNFRKIYSEKNLDTMKPKNADKLFYFSYLFSDDDLPQREKFFKVYNPREEEAVWKFYERKINPPYKNITTSVILSSIVPGLGKIYAGQTGDGIIAAITTGLCAFLAYDNFKANHKFRGWVFSGLTLFFYSGNIYGSAAAAQIFNAGINFNFQNELNLYLNQQNYFTPKYEFCK